MTKQRKMIKHDGYSSVVCEHHQDILTCDKCHIFKDGVQIVDKSSLWDKLKNPIQYLLFRASMKRSIKQMQKEQNRE